MKSVSVSSPSAPPPKVKIEDLTIPQYLESIKKKEEDYFSGLVPGVLYSVGDSPPQRYVPKSCWNHQGPCRVTCELYADGKCLYKESLDGDKYRRIDNEILFESSGQHPNLEHFGETQSYVENAGEAEPPLVVEKSCIPSAFKSSAIPITLEEEIDNFLKNQSHKRDRKDE